MYSDSIIHRYKRDGMNLTKCFDLSVFQNCVCTKRYNWDDLSDRLTKNNDIQLCN
jgi:hypothetical protein